MLRQCCNPRLALSLLSFFLLSMLYPLGSWGEDSTKILRGHISSVSAVSWSPDGGYLAATRGKTIFLWDFLQDSESYLRGKPLINDVVWSLNGRWLASAGFEGIVQVWDVATDKSAFLTISLRQRIDQIHYAIKLVTLMIFYMVLLLLLFHPLGYSLTAVPITVFIYFIGRRYKITWLKREYLVVYLPLLVWFIFWLLNIPSGKISGNYLYEPFSCGIPGGLILLPRLLLSAETKRKKLLIDLVSAVIACIIVLLIIFLTPPIYVDIM